LRDLGDRLSGGEFGAGLADDGEVLAGAFSEDFELAFLDGFGVDEFAADGDRAGAGAEEVGGGVEVDAAGGIHFDVGEGAFEGLDVLGATDVAAGKDLDDVGAGIPGGFDFGGGKSAGENDLGVALGHFDGGTVEGGGDEEFSAGEHADATGFGIEDGAGAESDAIPEFGGDCFEGFDGAGDGHGDFGDGDATIVEGFNGADGGFGGGGADDGDDADGDEVGEDLLFRH